MAFKYKKFHIILTLLIIIIVCLWISLYKNSTKESYVNIYNTEGSDHPEYKFGHADTSKIPNIIWTFWEGEPNEFVDKCILSWKNYNPEYKINIVTKENYRDYIDFDLSKIKHTNDSLARYSDYIRLCLLSKYGGIWMDASIICHSHFTWLNAIQKETNCETIGYYFDGFTDERYLKYSPVIESWFFACVPGSKFVRDWCVEFLRTANYDTIGDYVNNVKESGIDLQKINAPEYLAIHVAAQKVLQTNQNAYDIVLFSAPESPYKYLSDSNWNSQVAVDKLADENTRNYYYKFPIIKIRGLERQVLRNRDDISKMFSM